MSWSSQLNSEESWCVHVMGNRVCIGMWKILWKGNIFYNKGTAEWGKFLREVHWYEWVLLSFPTGMCLNWIFITELVSELALLLNCSLMALQQAPFHCRCKLLRQISLKLIPFSHLPFTWKCLLLFLAFRVSFTSFPVVTGPFLLLAASFIEFIQNPTSIGKKKYLS